MPIFILLIKRKQTRSLELMNIGLASKSTKKYKQTTNKQANKFIQQLSDTLCF